MRKQGSVIAIVNIIERQNLFFFIYETPLSWQYQSSFMAILSLLCVILYKIKLILKIEDNAGSDSL